MNIFISDKCQACGICTAIKPEIFNITDREAYVNQELIYGYEDDCIDAALACPVNAIKINDF
ncbi:ferredoxin [bacterium]|nr:ferredoxin [bacterium]